MRREFNVLALIKDEERYVYVYDDASRDALIRLFQDQAAAAEKANKASLTSDSFFLAIADLEERGSKNFESIGREVQSDRLLLDIEKSEVNEVLSKRQQTFLEELKEAVKRREASGPKEKTP